MVEQKQGLPVSLELKAMDLQCTFEPIEDTTSQSVFFYPLLLNPISNYNKRFVLTPSSKKSLIYHNC